MLKEEGNHHWCQCLTPEEEILEEDLKSQIGIWGSDTDRIDRIAVYAWDLIVQGDPSLI